MTLKAEHRLTDLLAAAGVARSTFFYHQARMDAPDPWAEVKAAISEIFARNHQRYGYRRVHRELIRSGWQLAKKTVLKLMRQLGLVSRSRRKRRYVSYHGNVGQTAENILDRNFTADAPNQKWVTDVTEFRVGDDKLYLSPVLDLFNREIIAFSTSRSPNLDLTNSALRAAITTLDRGQHPLVHSDQGFQYQHASWRALLADVDATQSMSRKGNCYDNAIMENFFGHLKEECFHHVNYLSIDALETALHDYIRWYNHDRISERLEGLSPVQYRTQTLAA
ncbi:MULTISPECIES: IS3 family transposase [Microbacterium]|uniref:IS3 family transposase n=1 Tax=Microbacterium TaxID=33882 RepID=UPI001EF5089A|nr:IS3 family transposase [Microbacterium sp. KCTC 39802]